MEYAYTKTAEEVLQHFQVSEGKGQSDDRVAELRERFGRNGNYHSWMFEN